jgi:hypothetical protein
MIISPIFLHSANVTEFNLEGQSVDLRLGGKVLLEGHAGPSWWGSGDARAHQARIRRSRSLDGGMGCAGT